MEKQDTDCPGTQRTTDDPGDPGTGTDDRSATPASRKWERWRPATASLPFYWILSTVFCEKTHPLVIFLDDLQWVDVDTLKLVERIAQHPERKALLFLGAYRDNEVDADHRLMISIEVIKKTGQPVQTIPLKPLNPEHISQLLAHTCHCRPEEGNPLTEVLMRKTGGNPFFVSQFLTVLSEKELIRYSPEEKRWTWELAAIKFLAVTDNVVELLIDRLHRFSAETRRLLSLAACIGNTFDLESLELISGEGSGEIDENLLPALESGLILGFSRAPERPRRAAATSSCMTGCSRLPMPSLRKRRNSRYIFESVRPCSRNPLREKVMLCFLTSSTISTWPGS